MSLRALFGLLAPGGSRSALSVLIFHRVLCGPDPLFPGAPDARAFERQMRWLKRWLTVLPFSTALDGLCRGALPARAAVITFDDGYADNHSVALAILRHHALPATFFVASGYLDGGRMWNDSVIEAVRRARGPALDLRHLGLGLLPLAGMEARRAAIASLLARLKYLPTAQREQAAQAVADCAGARLPDDLMLSTAQLRRLAAAGMTIGAHTISHPILTTLSDEQAFAEMTDSRRRLQEITGQEVAFFAYPNGKPGADYTGAHVALARKAGFAAAVTTAWGAARPGCDPYQIPRFTPWGALAAGYGLRLAQNLTRAAYAQA